MGKLITFILALIFIDLLFIFTGQVTDSISSNIFEALLDLGNFNATDFFKEMIGDAKDFFKSGTGIMAFFVGAGVTIGALFSKNDTLLFIPIALSFGVLAFDFVVIYSKLAEHSLVFATLIMAPVVIVFTIVIVDWVRGKD